ncbi:MAG: DUF2809 domain-containing protein [Lachnospiraceae bacterium]|nr:DUF2809 domain-containing protein [Lachnospiraceae bacterium]
MKKRIVYILLTVLLIAIEVLIALFVHDDFIRPYVGDAIVVIVIFCFVRIFIPEGCRLLPLYVFLFSVFVEILQYFRFVDLIGLGNVRFFRILIGGTFDFKDIVCYAAGCLLTGVFELIRMRFKKNSGKNER